MTGPPAGIACYRVPVRGSPWLLAIAALTLGCGDSGLVDANGEESEAAETGSDEASCPIGSEDCPCTGGGGCDPGLMCVDQICEGEGDAEGSEDGESGACTELGCDCDGSEDSCDLGLSCEDGSCVSTDCGNGALDAGEDCDDGNDVDGDGCDKDCSYTELIKVSAGGAHTCALIEGGRLRCWGHNIGGQLGYGVVDDIGDNETPAEAGDLPLPPGAVDVSAGGSHTCVVFEDGSVRCWGLNAVGQLGYGNSFTVFALGDDEPIDDLAPIDVGFSVDQIETGVIQTCARGGGSVRCWGGGTYGQLGSVGTDNIGDDEVPNMASALLLGGESSHINLGAAHGCALLSSGGVRCWGRNDKGQLGIGSTENIGDNEAPADSPEISLEPDAVPGGASVAKLELGLSHSCALFTSGEVVCWGHNDRGQLGQGNVTTWGDGEDEVPSMLTPVPLGGAAMDLAGGYDHTCALLSDGAIRCWGDGSAGQLGYGTEEDVGDDENVLDLEPVELGGTAVSIAAGAAHTCAILDDQRLMCWGNNQWGQLGYGFTHDVGDNELPEVAGTIDLL